MNMGYTVYLRKNLVNGKQYVGQTGDFRQRERCWSCLKLQYANNYFTEERKKYGLSNFETTILAEVETREEAWKLERKYIKEFNTIYPNGYNMSVGGGGGSGVKCTEEKKQSVRKANKGNKYHNKPVVQYDKNWNEIKVWNSAKEAAIALGISNITICQCCKGQSRHQTAGGFRWKKYVRD